jgi:hypothetical protein
VAGVLVAGSLVEGSLLVGAEVAAAEVVDAAVVEGTAVVVGALVGAAVVGAAVVVGWSAPGVPRVVVGCASAGRLMPNACFRPSTARTPLRRPLTRPGLGDLDDLGF